jgi:Mrp family chromosome partitioning ATPase
MNYIIPARHRLADAKRSGGTVAASPKAVRQQQAGRIADKTSPWKKSLIRAVAFTEARPARVVGITGIRRGVGASLVAQGLAQSYGEFDRRILLVSASAANLSESVAPVIENVPDLSALCVQEEGEYFRVDLADPQITLPPNVEFIRYTFELALKYFHAIVVDLPSTADAAGRPMSAFLSVAPACNFLFLVCPTGRTSRSEVQQCLASCKISGANVEGILLNDYRLPASSLLSES